MAFLPQATISTSMPWRSFSLMSFSAWRSTLLLNPPASPRSDAMTTIRARLTSSCVASSGSESSGAYFAVEMSISEMALAHGRALYTRSEARRILAAATISMVRVICFVEETELMRRSMS